MEAVVELTSNGIAIIRPVGRVDLLAAPALKQRLSQTAESGHARLVVDLQEVTFIDSSGLGALISGLRAARLAGGDLRIARPSEQARMLFQLTKLDRVLETFPTVEEATAAYE